MQQSEKNCNGISSVLICKEKISLTNDAVFDCGTCTRCSPISNNDYPFLRDLDDSQFLVDLLKKEIEKKFGLVCKEPVRNKDPDLRVIDARIGDLLICRVEAKYLRGKAFVNSYQTVGLRPKETLVVDEPKLLHYFSCKEADANLHKRQVPLFVVWMFDRPCEDIGRITVFQEIDVLKRIYNNHPTRRFTRGAASSDNKNGVIRGVIDKYHFSIKETRPIEELFSEIAHLVAVANSSVERASISPRHTRIHYCTDCTEIFTPKFDGAKLCIKCWIKSKQK